MNVWRYLNVHRKVIGGMLLSPLRPGNIAMFHSGRSGSSVLSDLLGQHPNIFWDGEIYNRDKLKDHPKRTHYLTRKPMQYLRLRRTQAGNRFYGFETVLFGNQLELIGIKLPDYIEQLQALKFNYFLILKRKNNLRKIVSSIIARKTMRWHQTIHEKPELTQIELDLDNVRIGLTVKPLIVWLQDHQETFQILEELLRDQNVLYLTYENDISTDPLIAYRRICKFLDLDQHPVSIRYSKTNPFKLTELISNFEETRHTLCGTPFEWMLYQ